MPQDHASSCNQQWLVPISLEMQAMTFAGVLAAYIIVINDFPE
jgi:hypothetical protein